MQCTHTSARETSEQEFPMRRPGFAAPGLLIIATLLLIGALGGTPALARQEASPAAGTPAAPPPTQPPAPTAAPQAATPAPPAAPATTDVVTLVLWYANAADQDIIELYPLATTPTFVASQGTGAPAGTVNFSEDGVSPTTVVVGDTTFETYPRPDGSTDRWTWLDDFEGARPATLVMQLSGSNGTYQNYYGTATMMSRDEGGAGGVLILALRPPAPAAPAEAAGTPAAEAAPEEQSAEAAEPAADTGGIVIEGEATEPAA
jgi:hypothetical protein